MFGISFLKMALAIAIVIVYQDVRAQRYCGTIHPMADTTIQDENVETRYLEFENRIRKQSQQKNYSGVITIPVVFHIVHDGDNIGSNENISESYINEQLEQLNDDFRRTNADRDSTWSQAADTEIEFCLASIDPSGNPASGILRHNIPGGPWTRTKFEKDVKPQTIWNRNEYLNIWSAELAGDLLGYAQFPGGDETTDGVVCLYGSLGSLDLSQSGTAPYNKGRTLTHEVGHWLGLYHIWGDVNGCGGSDEVSDTPDQESSTSGCPSGVELDVCTGSAPGYMYQNYMDYSYDECMNLFTVGQKTRMKAAISEYRSGLNSAKCSNGGPLAANFSPTSGPIEVCPGGQIQFLDLSTGDVQSRSWTFTGAGVSPLTSSLKNPIVEVTSSGDLSAYLLVNDNIDISDKTLNIPVTVLDISTPGCVPPPCLDFDINGGPYADLYFADGAFLNCDAIATKYGVYSGEAYILSGLLAGTTYTLEFCDGYSPEIWEAVITIGKYDKINNKAFPNSEIAHSGGCSLSFTPTESDDYLAVIGTAQECNAGLDNRENGFITFNCNTSPDSICGMTFMDNGGDELNYSPNQSKVYTLCPDNPDCEMMSLVFSEFDLEDSPDCTSDYMIIYQGVGPDKEIIGKYCGSNTPGTVVSNSGFGCLTIEFYSDDVVSNSKGWIASIVCLDDGTCENECPKGYSLSGVEIGDGGPLHSGKYYTDGYIMSSQIITNGNVSYDAKSSVSLHEEFSVNVNSSFSIGVEGCLTGSGSKKSEE